MYSVSTLADTLVAEPEEMWVRVAAHWLTDGDPSGPPPVLTGRPVVDALVAAVTAHRARGLGLPVPAWTLEPERTLQRLWHPSQPEFFSWSFAHTPDDLKAHGVIIESDSLVSV